MSFTLNPKSAPKSDAQASGEIRLVNLTKRFDDTHAVKDINLTIPHGSYCCLLGPSGCGKTTILRMIAGHETPTSGRDLHRRPDGRGQGAGRARHGDDVPKLRALPAPYHSRQRRLLSEDARRREGRASQTCAPDAGARPARPSPQSHARPALGRPAAARCARPRADYKPEGSSPRRAAFGAGRISPPADARRIEELSRRNSASPSCMLLTRSRRRSPWPTPWW